MSLSQRDLERRLGALGTSSKEGFVVRPCFVGRATDGFVVYDGEKRDTRRFVKASDTAFYIMKRAKQP